ncbi:MAG: hypothetical protein ABI277_12420 [Burkholderiaceae bacterium]
MSDAIVQARLWLRQPWQVAFERMRAFAYHPDPLVEASNWVALLIGTHLPFWPLYVWWSAGTQALPTAILKMALAPLFLIIPLISRRSGLLGRVATPLVGIANTVFTIWILGANSGTALFLAPCTALAAFSFRRNERWLMLLLTALPLAVYYLLQQDAPVPLHHYDDEAAKRLFVLNVISVSVISAAFGWLQSDIYERMEKRTTGVRNASDFVAGGTTTGVNR